MLKSRPVRRSLLWDLQPAWEESASPGSGTASCSSVPGEEECMVRAGLSPEPEGIRKRIRKVLSSGLTGELKGEQR